MNDFKPRSKSADAARSALDELETLHSALSAVADLATPSADLNTVGRDNLATLLDLLLRMQGEANRRAWEGLGLMLASEAEAERTKFADLADLIKNAEGKPQGEDT